MARTDKSYQEAEKRVNEAQRLGKKRIDLSRYILSEVPEELEHFTQLQELDLSENNISELPSWLGKLNLLKKLNLSKNRIAELPEELWKLTLLQKLDFSYNQIEELPEEIGQLTQLQELSLSHNQLVELPEEIGKLTQLRELNLSKNWLSKLPTSLGNLPKLILNLTDNPLEPELAAVYQHGIDAVRAYLRAKFAAEIKLNEAKLILVGEGEVGKSCLLGALRGDPWVEGLPTTHGIEIKTVNVIDAESNKEITLNGWDFGGQRVYRPTHQLFFSAPAVYLVVWKPREGPYQGFVKEWIKLIKQREPTAKILVVATHGGPQQRQPDIDRQELRDLFGKDTIIDFFHVDSKPGEDGKRRGIEELKQAIARVASSLPEMGRSIPKRWQEVREELAKTEAAYLPLERVLELCHEHQMSYKESRLFVTISHQLGHLIHYEHDPALRDFVVLKPDWLATAISFVLDDEVTRNAHGLVLFSRLGRLWNDPDRSPAFRYPKVLHPIFLRLMERFDLSYRVADPSQKSDNDPLSLIAQLVPDIRPENDLERMWLSTTALGDIQQTQICRIVDNKGQSSAAEGLFYQLIVRLHKYSLGRVNYRDSVHWQRGLVLDADYNGRALLEHIGNDLRITVRAPYPERFLAMLTSEVKYLVESFWEGLQCEVMVPCIEQCGKGEPGTGLYDVQKLIESKRKGRVDFPCPVCNEWQVIDNLLRNAPAIRPMPIQSLLSEFIEVRKELSKIRPILEKQQVDLMGRFDQVDVNTQRILSRVDDAYTNLLHALIDEAKEGPRLFSLIPANRTIFNPKQWTSAKFILTLWCEHSRKPLPAINGNDSKKGVYEIELSREWFKKAAPFLKVLTTTLSLVLPVAASGVKLALDENVYRAIEEQLDFGKEVIDATLEGGKKIGERQSGDYDTVLEHGDMIRAHGATLRELQTMLKAKDPGFGGLVRVRNKRQEFLWVHPMFESEY